MLQSCNMIIHYEINKSTLLFMTDDTKIVQIVSISDIVSVSVCHKANKKKQA